MCEVLFLLRAVLNILVRNASPRGPMCFRCLVIFALFYCLLDLRSGECDVVCFACLTVFVNCLVKQFLICLGVVVILLLSVVPVSV